MKMLFHVIALCTPRFVFLTGVALCLIFPPVISAQWTNVAPNLLGKQGTQMSCITNRAGIIWAGTKEVFMSPDLGKTWAKRSPTLLPKDVVRHITFYDANIGLVGTTLGHLYLTYDQGVTWRDIRMFSVCSQAAFLGSPDNIVVATGVVGEIHSTRDGGGTWNITSIGTYIPDLKPLLGSGILALVGSFPPGAPWSEIHIMKSLDYGATWIQMLGKLDYDTWSFDVDPCNRDEIYVVNEDGSVSRDNSAQIFRSTDGGISWNVSHAEPISDIQKFFCGSISISGQAIFVQTLSDGVWRSTDKGVSWKMIGGPTAPIDTRLLSAVNGNLVFAADADGSIWRTQNSGGDSLPIASVFDLLTVSPPRLFSKDSLTECDSPAVNLIRLKGYPCIPAKVTGEKIIGIDSLDYTITKSIGDTIWGNDSAAISFLPRDSGSRRGFYVISLEDGSEISIPLEGYRKSKKHLELVTFNAKTDTIGGAVAIPITITGLDRQQDIEFVTRYDTSLVYLGSYSNNGTRIDIPGDAWLGGSRIHLTKNLVRRDTASGFAYFIVWPSDKPCPKVTFDSLDVSRFIAPCEYTYGAGIEATICPPSGCGIIAISNFMRYGVLPQLKIYPNPTSGELQIVTSSDIHEASVKVIDAVGKCWMTKHQEFKKQILSTLDLSSLPTGLYHLIISSATGSLTTTVSVIK